MSLLTVPPAPGRRQLRWWVVVVWCCLLLVSCCCPTTGVLGDLSISTVSTVGTLSPVAPSPTSHPHTSTSSHPPTSTSSPSPTPPTTPFLEYVLKDTLYFRINQMTITISAEHDQEGYYNLTVEDYPALQSHPSSANVTVTGGDKMNFTKYYRYNKTGETDSTFAFTFILTLELTSTDQMWYMSSFTHHNYTHPSSNSTTNHTCSFHYSGVNVIHAPSDLSYSCADLKFKGDCVNNIKSEVHFVGLFIQAFQLKDKTPSSTYIDCGAKAHNNSIINVVVGSVMGATLGIALIVIVTTLVIKAICKKVQWRGYNLLDD